MVVLFGGLFPLNIICVLLANLFAPHTPSLNVVVPNATSHLLHTQQVFCQVSAAPSIFLDFPFYMFVSHVLLSCFISVDESSFDVRQAQCRIARYSSSTVLDIIAPR